ncbi:MAG: lipopolysaccharide heptosyltransferase II [bacterium]|nr:lipopolysaccharide heptosyltransferase II [bacterium]
MQRLINKILVIRFSSIGDIVLTTPVLRTLRERYPYAKLCFVVKKEFLEITKLFPHIDKVFVFDSKDGFMGLIKLIGEINSEQFDLLIDLHWNLRSMIIYLFSQIRHKIHYSKHRFLRLLRIWFKWQILPQQSHIIDLYFNPLTEFGILSSDNRVPELKIDKDMGKNVLECLKELGIEDRDLVIGMCPSAKWKTKQWPTEGFVEAGNRLMEELNAKIVLIGDAHDMELGKKIEAWMDKKPLNLVNWTSLLELPSLIQRCDILITNDSAPLHIAAALGVSTVSMFGPTTLDLGFGPHGNGKHIVLERELPCRPCSSHGSSKCPQNTHECMTAITPEDVVDAVKNLLGVREGSS